jgi:hypothetical protein
VGITGYGLKVRQKEASIDDNSDRRDTKTDLQANKQTNKQNVKVIPGPHLSAVPPPAH